MNPYVTVDHVLAELWCKAHRSVPESARTVKKCMRDCEQAVSEAVKTEDIAHTKTSIARALSASGAALASEQQEQADAVSRAVTAPELLKAIVSLEAVVSPGAHSCVAKACSAQRHAMVESVHRLRDDRLDARLVSDTVQQWAQQTKGLRQERHIIDEFSQEHLTKVSERNTANRVMMVGEVRVTGRFDGLTEDGWVLEVKQRKARLFHRVPAYELVQCEVYCRMADAPGTVHVERLTETCKKATRLPRNDALWARIREALAQFKQRYENMEVMEPLDRNEFIVSVSKAHGPLRL